jgi:ParB/Sulfiredoxin domain
MMEDLANIAARVLASGKDFNKSMTASEVLTADGEIVKIHPTLTVIPLMKKDEMTRLVKSIKKNGLRNPIVVDASGVLIDGRCRLMSCELAGVPPRFETLPEGVDLVDYICACNIERQDHSKQQEAMGEVLLGVPIEEEEPGGDTSLA